MRFDDRLSTILAGGFDSPRARAFRWQQLTDILAQAGHLLPEAVAVRLLRLTAMLSPDVPPARFIGHTEALVPQCRYMPLLVLLARQDARAAETVVAAAKVSDEEWVAAIPEIGPVARALLRRREDVGPMVQMALRLFAASDLTLTGPAADSLTASAPATDIRELVKRIEEYRQRQPVAGAREAPAVVGQRQRVGIATDAAGRIIDADVRGRGRFVGIDLAQPAAAFASGCDAGTARLVGKRQPVTAGRILVTGDDIWSGTWICEAQPRFAMSSGMFEGYTGILRRPHPHEAIDAVSAPANEGRGEGVSSDMLRQLMHELRSPLNAVLGFAQLIDGQYAGPVSSTYRSAARTILGEAGRLSSVIDELDLLAQLSLPTGGQQATDGPVDVASIVKTASEELAATRQRVELHVAGDEQLERVFVDADPAALVRLLRLWLQPLAEPAVGDAGASSLTVVVRADVDADSVELLVTRPAGHAAKSDDGRLGFGLTMAQELARQLGGSLDVSGDQYILNIPTLAVTAVSGEQVG